MIKSFRGKISNDSQNRIRLSTNNGLIGYRILKFQVMPETPKSTTEEATMQIFSTDQSDNVSDYGNIDFGSPVLLAAAFFSSHSTTTTYPEDTTVIFDTKVFNQDIYVTCNSSGNMNYHIELEKVKLDLNEATVATLKDLRGSQ